MSNDQNMLQTSTTGSAMTQIQGSSADIGVNVVGTLPINNPYSTAAFADVLPGTSAANAVIKARCVAAEVCASNITPVLNRGGTMSCISGGAVNVQHLTDASSELLRPMNGKKDCDPSDGRKHYLKWSPSGIEDLEMGGNLPNSFHDTETGAGGVGVLDDTCRLAFMMQAPSIAIPQTYLIEAVVVMEVTGFFLGTQVGDREPALHNGQAINVHTVMDQTLSNVSPVDVHSAAVHGSFWGGIGNAFSWMGDKVKQGIGAIARAGGAIANTALGAIAPAVRPALQLGVNAGLESLLAGLF